MSLLIRIEDCDLQDCAMSYLKRELTEKELEMAKSRIAEALEDHVHDEFKYLVQEGHLKE